MSETRTEAESEAEGVSEGNREGWFTPLVGHAAVVGVTLPTAVGAYVSGTPWTAAMLGAFGIHHLVRGMIYAAEPDHYRDRFFVGRQPIAPSLTDFSDPRSLDPVSRNAAPGAIALTIAVWAYTSGAMTGAAVATVIAVYSLVGVLFGLNGYDL